MKKTGILNDRIAAVVASMGHTDMMVVCDAGFPVPLGVERIDLAVAPNLPRFFDVLDAVVGELEVEEVIIAEETRQVSPAVHEQMLRRFPKVKQVHYVAHVEFKRHSRDARAVIRTGEFTPYANIILVSGVVY